MGVQILINFDKPSHTFRPGEVITGNVSISSSQNVTVNKGLTITFHGFGAVCWSETKRESIYQNRQHHSHASIDDPNSPFYRQTHLDYEHHRHLNHDSDYQQYQHGHSYNHSSNHNRGHQITREYRNEETYLLNQITLPINLFRGGDNGSNTIELPAGHYHQVPFTFQLPRNIPSNCRMSHGLIDYCAIASLKVKKSLLVLSTEVIKSTRREFKILGTWDLEHVNNALRPLQLNQQRQFGGIFCFCCCTSGGEGEFGMDLRLARTGFIAGESINFHLNFRNETRVTVKKMEADLTQIITFVTFGKELKEKHTINRLAYNSRIVPGSNGTWSDQVKIPQTAYLTDLGGSRIILIKYVLSVTAKASFCRKAKLEVPITIGTVPERGGFHH